MLTKPSGIPRQSGCYLFRNEHGAVIYVGKARVLAQRLSSYFQRVGEGTPEEIAKLDTATGTVLKEVLAGHGRT